MAKYTHPDKSDNRWKYCKRCGERTIASNGICLDCQKKGKK